jgi:hypothetical protein
MVREGNMKARLAAFGILAGASALTWTGGDAHACGGCFVPSESTVVTGHRMAFAVSPTQTVLWDQIQYAGDPSEFSWVLPVKRGAYVQVANDAFFDVLDPATAIAVQAPPEGCSVGSGADGFGCGASAEDRTSLAGVAEGTSGGFNGENGVDVLHEGSVGPYETVTVASEDPNALVVWLTSNGYVVPDSIVPVIDGYVEEGFDFIALKLQPGQGVRQMKPVRVVTPGSGPVLPLRMVAAGVGAKVDLVLFVIGEGRYQAKDFDNVLLAPELVSWDFKTDRSSYAELRLATLGAEGSRTWLTTYARAGALLSPVTDPIGFNSTVGYTIGDPSQVQSFASTIAAAYLHQGFLNDEHGLTDELELETEKQNCITRIEGLAGRTDVVVNPCDSEGKCRALDGTELDYRQLACGALDDIGVALVGMHPADVLLTRIEASLPVEALDADLVVEASLDQSPVVNRFVAGIKLNACWDQPSASGVTVIPGKTGLPRWSLVVATFGGLGLYLLGRRLRRS